MNWQNKYNRAVTFSYDDGNEQDIRLITILERYRLKATFHVNTGLNYDNATWQYGDLTVHRLNLDTAVDVYRNHEVAVHGQMHLNWTELSQAELKAEIEENIHDITRIFGYTPIGLSYPYGAYNDEVINIVTQYGMQYGRGTTSSHSFKIPDNLLAFSPTCHHDDPQIDNLIDKFLTSTQKTSQVLYIWGHSYELEGKRNWDKFERICEKLAGRKDIFYGTNCEVLL